MIFNSNYKNKNFDSNYNDLRKKQEDLYRKEKDLKEKEAELENLRWKFENSDTFKKQFELSKITYYKDKSIIITGINVQIFSTKYSYDLFLEARSKKIKRSYIYSPVNKDLYPLSFFLLIVGLCTISLGFGIFLFVIGFVVLFFGLIKKILLSLEVLLKDWIWPKYKLSLIGKSRDVEILIDNVFRIKKLKKMINSAIETYYAT